MRAAPASCACRRPARSDTAPLAAAIDRGEIDPATIVAIVGKTEGNGCVNDFTRGYATLALKLLLAERLKCPMAEVEARVAIVMSGGTEGGLSPHLLVFCREAGDRRRVRAAARHRHRPDAALQARGDRPRRADRGDRRGRGRRHEGCRHRHRRRRAFRPDQVPAAHQGAHRGGRARAAPPWRPTTPTIRWPCRAAPRRWASRWRWARSTTPPKPPSAATGRSIPRSPAPRPASSCCATRSSCWATRRTGQATW